MGTAVVVASENIEDYAKVDKIILRAEGYKDVEFTDVPINENFAKLPPVVMGKVDLP